MFSNDRNIETIGQLVEAFKHYIGLQQEYVRLDAIEKVVRLMTVVTMALVLSVLLVMMLIYLSFAAAYALSPCLGMVGAFCVVAGCYLVLLVLCVVFRHQWIEKPLVKFLAGLLMSN